MKMRSSSFSSSPGASTSSAGKMLRRLSDTTALAAFRRVSKYQHCQIVTLAFAFLFSTATCLSLSYVNYLLTPDCILFATWHGRIRHISDLNRKSSWIGTIYSGNESNSEYESHIRPDLITSNENSKLHVLELDTQETKWGKKRQCFLTQYGYAAAAASSFILCWFFVFFRPTKQAYYFRKKTAASKLIIPGILFTFAFTICILVAAITLQMGFASWCNSMTTVPNIESCSSVEDFALQTAGKTGKPVNANYFSLLLAGQIFAWLGAVAWISSLATLIARCYYHVDFPDYFFEHSALNADGIQTDTDQE